MDEFSNIFIRLVEHLTVEELRLVAHIARQIWFRRNGFVFKEEFRSPRELIQAARNQMNLHDQATTTSHTDISTGVNMGNLETVYWTKPPAGVIKINWDAALDL